MFGPTGLPGVADIEIPMSQVPQESLPAFERVEKKSMGWYAEDHLKQY